MELLCPAGGPEKLRAAVRFGADAVYLAGTRFGLRAGAGNFTAEQLAEGVAFAHAHGVKAYLAVNVLAHPEDLDGLRTFLREADAADVDACVVSDPGVFTLVQEEAPRLALHVSTQASVVNARSCRFWHGLGARRIVLARELSLVEIRAIRADVPADLELEAFVHGSMCVAHSGRCLLSLALAGRDANRGRCAQPCRWKYALVEEKRPGEAFPIEQDEGGSYVMNSRDLCMVGRLADLRDAGVDSLKIEGRAKSAFYAAATAKAYRMALAALDGDPDAGTEADWRALLDRTSHRPFSTGFFYDDPRVVAQVHAADSAYRREADVVAEVVSGGDADAAGAGPVEALASQRNRFFRGERLVLIRPKGRLLEFSADDLRDGEGRAIDAARHPTMAVRLTLPAPAEPGSYLARALPPRDQTT